VVYELGLTGTLTLLHTFNVADLEYHSGVILDSAGNLYGTSSQGGAYNFGVVYKLDPRTGTETVLHNFTGGADGGTPGGVILDAAGNLFGTTYYGGAGHGTAGYGVVYKLGPARKKLTVLYTFTGGADGAHPTSGVIVRR
jgi:uncharacterized repeat protein (TIGR03803 family)